MKKGKKDRAGLAGFKFVPGGRILRALTEGPVQEPAEVAALEFPGRTMFAFQALFLLPAWCQAGVPTSLIDEQEKDLTLDM